MPKVPKVTKSRNLGKKEVRHKFNFLHEDKTQSFLEADTIVFGGHNQACPKYPKQQVFAIFFAASLEPLAHRRNVASLSLFSRYYFGRCSSELAQLIPRPFSQARSTGYCDRLHDLSIKISWCYKDFYVNSFFPCTARLWTSLPTECFILTYDH